MPIIEVEGVGQVEVGDEFTALSPEQQQATVDEIAATAQQPQTLTQLDIAPGGGPPVQVPQPVPAMQGASLEASPSGAMFRGFEFEGEAARQGTSPVVRTFGGEAIRPVLGEAVVEEVFIPGSVESQSQQGGGLTTLVTGYRDAQGNVVPVDQSTMVALPDPQTGKLTVFRRTEDTEEGRVTRAARLMLPGMAAGAPTRIASAAPGTVMSARGARQAELMSAAERQGIPVTGPMVSESRVVRGGASILREAPLSSGVMERGIERTGSAIAQRADELASGLSAETTRQGAGASMRTGLERFRDSAGRDFDLRNVSNQELGAFIRKPASDTSFAKKAAAMYERVARAVPETSTGVPTRTLRMLDEIKGRFNNPALREQFQNSFFGRLEASLEGAQTWRDLRQLRTEVRQLRAQPLSEAERTVSNAQIKRLEAALTDDIKFLTEQAGGKQALRALNQADRFYRSGITRLERARRLLKVESDEAVFDRVLRMAQARGGEDAKRLTSLRRSVSPAEWNDMASVVIRRLGQPTPGAADQGAFSVGSFVTNYNALSPRGRRILFDRTGQKTLREALDDLGAVAGAQKAAERFSVPTGAGMGASREAGQIGVLGAALAFPTETIMALVGATTAAAAMNSPRFVRWLANTMRVSRGPDAAARLPAQLVRLRELARSDPRLAEIANVFASQPFMATENQQGGANAQQGVR